MRLHSRNTAYQASLDMPLLDACEKGNIGTVQKLLRRGADPNGRDDHGRVPVIIAAQHGHTPIVALLIQYGADLYATDHNEWTALHHAVYEENADAVHDLVTQLLFDPNIQDQCGQTPFLLAAENGNKDMLRVLVQLGANPHATDHQGRNALHYAAPGNARLVFEFLITCLHLDPNQQDHEGNTPLLIAMKHGNTLIA